MINVLQQFQMDSFDMHPTWSSKSKPTVYMGPFVPCSNGRNEPNNFGTYVLLITMPVSLCSHFYKTYLCVE
jgi:hypothetical protein